MSVTYTKTVGSFAWGVTVEALDGMVIEHPFDSSRGGGYGRKHPTGNPEGLAREIGADLEAAGYVRNAGVTP